MGVDVTIDVLDSNGNYRKIGTANTDASGAYTLTLMLDIPRDYTAVATFHGTNGYWPSYAETSFAVDPTAPTTTPTEAPPQSTADMYFVPAIAGIRFDHYSARLSTISAYKTTIRKQKLKQNSLFFVSNASEKYGLRRLCFTIHK